MMPDRFIVHEIDIERVPYNVPHEYELRVDGSNANGRGYVTLCLTERQLRELIGVAILRHFFPEHPNEETPEY